MSRPPRRHGTLAMRTRGECQVDPCQPCRDAGSRYHKVNEHERANGRVRLVDAAPAREHARRLLDGGIQPAQLEKLSGVHRTSIRVLVGDFPNRKMSARIRPETAAALLAIPADPLLAVRPIGAMVDATGTRRRLEALLAIGYTGTDLAVRLGSVSPRAALQTARRPIVHSLTATKVRELYEQLSDVPGPSARTRTWALGKGMLPPAWWDDDEIDDPQHEPDGLRRYRQGGRVLVDDVTKPRHERIRYLLMAGLTRPEIAEHLGVRIKNVHRDIRERL